jgi:hypothetical protein
MVRRFINFATSLITFAVMGSLALAQEPSQPPPTTDHCAHHGQTGQPTGQPSMGGDQRMGGMIDQGMMGQQMMDSSQPGQSTGQPMMGCPMMAGMMGQVGMGHGGNVRVTPQ